MDARLTEPRHGKEAGPRAIGLFATLYFLAALLCGAVPSWPGWAIYQWLPGGLLVAWLAKTPVASWPRWIAGAALATLAFGFMRAGDIPAGRQVAFFFANLGGALVGGLALKRALGDPARLEKPEQFPRFLVAGFVSAGASALLLPLLLPGGYGMEHAHLMLFGWFANAQAGIWVLAPLALAWTPDWKPLAGQNARARLLETALLGVALVLAQTTLAPHLADQGRIDGRFPALIAVGWAAARLGRVHTGFIIVLATVWQAIGRPDQATVDPAAMFDTRLHALLDAGLLSFFGYGLALAFHDQRRSRLDAERFAAVVKKTGASVVLTNAERRITWVNPGFTNLSGHSEGEALGRTPAELLQGPDTDRETVRRISQRLRAGKGFTEVLLNYRRDGSTYWNHVDVEPIQAPDGGLEGYIGVQVDVSRLREAESLRAFVRHAPVALAMIDREGRVLVASDRWCRLLAPDAGQPAGRPLAETVRPLPDGWSRADDAVRGAEAEAWTRADGARLVLRWESRPWRDQAGRAGGVVIFAEDIAERLAAEAAIRAEAERFDLLSRATHEMIWDWDVKTGVQWWNAAYHAFFGTDPATFVPTYAWWLERIHPEDRVVALDRFERFCAGRESCFTAELRLRAADGRHVPVDTKGYCLRDAEGRIVRMIGAVDDLTAQREAEQARAIRSKLEATGTLAAGIAHDFNNLSTSLMLNLDLALLKGRDNFQRAEEFIRSAQDAVMTSRALTERLLAFSEGGAAVRAAIDPELLLRRSIEPVLVGTGVQLTLEVPEDMPWMEGEEYQLEQVFRNLAANACEAMPEGGVLAVSAGVCAWEGTEAGGPAAGRYVRVRVADTGPGVAPDLTHRIFDPYFSTKPRGNRKGQGLGLTICQSVLRRHGGAVRLARAEPGGAVFEVFVPAADRPEQPGGSAPASSAGAVRRPLRVLVMDDEPVLREAIGELLALHGDEPVLTADGEEAVARYAAARTEGRPFDAVVLDLIIHGGKGGELTLAELRLLDPDVAAVAISGYANADAMRRHERHGFRAALAKPFKMDDLLETIRRIARPAARTGS